MCTFDINLQETANSFVTKAKTAITNHGGTFNGNDTAGSFGVSTPVGRIEGNYQIAGATATINITKKPILVGCGAIQNYVNNNV